MAKSHYKLSRELVGHTGDVRGIAVGADGSVVSVSRDKTAILWKFLDGNYAGNVVMAGHSNFVSSACIINPSEKYPSGFVVTGSNDNHIFIYNTGETQPTQKIKAHENTVCCLRTSNVNTNSYLSSSWDITAKLWNLDNPQKPQLILTGHSAAVWCVSDLPNGYIVTGSADKTVIVYLKDGSILHKLEGHTDCVRDIAVIKENEFLTCANDAIIKHWSALTGDCLGNYYGHSNYIYSIAALPDGSLTVSSGEDRTIRVWINGEMEQTISLPAQSIWSVKLLPNEDIVCGASDGFVRIFSANPERYADLEIVQRFEESVANEQKIDDMKLNNLADASALNEPGKKEGEIKLIKEANAVKAYSWSQQGLKWNLVGDVTGSNSPNSGKQLYNGIEYDYVFSVDIQDGVPPLKLPYNNGQDPWHVAQKFIDDNNLSQFYLEQVANFIIKNSTAAPVVNSAPQFYDPFTGGSRYIPTSGSATQTTTPPTPVNKPTSTPESCAYIPLKNFLKVEQANLNAIQEKLKEFNTKAEAGIQKISDVQVEAIMKLATNQNNEAIAAGAINTLKSLLVWPDQVVFPVLDIARLAVLQKNVNEQLCTDDFINIIKRHLRADAVASNQMLTFRLLANMFCHETGERLCLQHKEEILKAVLALSSLGSKNNQVAISTYILNLAVAINKGNDSVGKIQVADVICSLLGLFKEVEAVFRVLVGLGTLLISPNNSERVSLISVVRQSENALSILQTVVSESIENKLISVSKSIIEMIV